MPPPARARLASIILVRGGTTASLRHPRQTRSWPLVASGVDEVVAAYVADEAVAEAEAATVVTTAVAVKTTVMTIF